MTPLVLDKRSNSDESLPSRLRIDDEEQRISVDNEVESINSCRLLRQSCSRKLVDDEAGNTSASSLYVNTGTSKELLDVKNCPKKLSMMDGGPESCKSGVGLNTDSGSGKTLLRKELLTRKTSLTPREFEFLNELVQSSEVNADQLKKAAQVLGDTNIFFDCDRNDSDLHRGQLPQSLPARFDHQTSSSKRMSALRNRCASNIYYNLWKLHEKGISTNTSRNPRSSFYARRSMRSFNSRNDAGRPRADSLITDTQKGYLSLDNVVTLVAQQIHPSVSTTLSAEISSQPLKTSGDSVLPQRPPLASQLETLQEEGSYRITSSESTTDQRKNDIGNRNSEDPSPSKNDQCNENYQKCSDRKEKDWWETSVVEKNDSLLEIMKESSEAAASLPVVPRSTGGSSKMSQIRSFPSLRRAHSVHSASSISLAPSSLYNADIASPTGTSLSRKTSFASIHRARPIRSFSSSYSLRSLSVCSLDDMDLERATRCTGLSPVQVFSVLRNESNNLQRKNTIRRNISSGRQVSFCKELSFPLDDTFAYPLRPMRLITREASVSAYAGEGIEVMDPITNEEHLVASRLLSGQSTRKRLESGCQEDPEALRHMPALFHASDSNLDNGKRNAPPKPRLGREKSDGTISDIERIWQTDSNKDFIEKRWDVSWDMTDDDDEEKFETPPSFDGAWQILNDDSILGMSYGGGGTLPFLILGTSANDASAQPHVLSPPLMESLLSFVPYKLLECNLWLKYSLVRDGSSLTSLLQHVRGSQYTILAVETVEGEVFGSFTSAPWRKSWGYFGNGQSFLWRMRESRAIPCKSVIDQAQRESEIDVFPWTGENDMIQVCRSDIIAVGGGSSQDKGDSSGFGIVIESDLLQGSTNPCVTYDSPCLSRHGGTFDIVNLEIWTFTPCYSEEEAQKLELMHLFLEGNGQ